MTSKSAYHFGNAWNGKAYKTGTTEYYDGKNPTKITDWFRAYDNIEDATEDYFDMLCKLHCNGHSNVAKADEGELFLMCQQLLINICSVYYGPYEDS